MIMHDAYILVFMQNICILEWIVAYVCVAILACFAYGELLMQASVLLLL
jgi:hypothetical protein